MSSTSLREPEQVREFRREIEANPALAAEAEGTALLRDIEGFISRFVVLPPNALLPVSLWAAATHLFEKFEMFPYLAILSPTKRAGKTQLMRILELLCWKPFRCVFPSPAVLYRVIHQRKPTLLIDEVEFLAGKKSEIAQAVVAVLDAGFESGGVVPRCGGPKGDKLEYFRAYCPKCFATIGKLPDTLADRSIVLRMQRKSKSEKIDRLSRTAKGEGKTLKAEWFQYVKQIEPAIAEAYDKLPDLEFLQDREADCWSPLFALCSVVAPARLDELRRCAERLGSEKAAADTEDSIRIKLLADIRSVWPEGEKEIFSRELKKRLVEAEESPWEAEWKLTPRKLARMLSEFGIPTGKTIRVGHETAKGYQREDFELVFSRYLPVEVSHPSQPA